MKHILSAILASLLILISNQAAAIDLYAETGVMVLTADDSLANVHAVVPKLKLGYAITEHYMIELQYAGSGDDSDDDSGASINLDNVAAAYLRLDSDLHGGFRLYLLIGQAESSLTSSGLNGFTSTDNSYSDTSWGVGIEDRTWGRNLFLTLDYVSYYSEDDTRLYGASIGIKYAF